MGVLKLYDLTINLDELRMTLSNDLLYVVDISNAPVLYAQFEDSTFNKIINEMDGETIYDVDDRTQDHQGYIGSVTNVKPSKIDNKEEMEFIDKTKIILR